LAIRVACLAAAASVPDEPMTQLTPLLSGEKFDEVVFDVDRICLCGQTKPEGEPADMGINHNSLIDLEGIAKHDIGRLATHSGQCGEFLHSAGNFAAVFLHQNGSHCPDRLGFVSVKAGGVDDRLQFLLRDSGIVGSSAAACEEGRSDHVHADIGALG